MNSKIKTQKLHYRLYLALLISILLSCKGVDSQINPIVDTSELVFNNEHEEHLFDEYLKTGHTDYLELMFTSNSDLINFEFEPMKDEIRRLKTLSKSFEHKSPKSRMKKIFSAIHDEQLKKYELQCQFSDLFTSGTYNCLTASFLYGYVFDETGIPYEIMELPNHIYILAYPETERIKVETTNPEQGLMLADDRQKSQFVKYLKATKIISEEEFKNNSTDQLFDEYYLTETRINLRELVALQYYNLSIKDIEKENLDAAYQKLEKALTLYNTPRIEYMMYELIVSLVNKQEEYSSLEDINLIIKLSRYQEHGITVENIMHELMKFMQKELFEKGNVDLVVEGFNHFNSATKDSFPKLYSESSFYYNFEMGRYFLLKNQVADALNYFDVALSIKESSIETQNAYINCLALQFNEMNILDIVDSLKHISNKHKELKENNQMKIMNCNAYLLASNYSFYTSNYEEGTRFLEMFEKYYRKNEPMTIDKEIISEAYIAGAMYFFRRGNYKSAKQILKRELAISPNNMDLQVSWRSLKEKLLHKLII